MSYLVAQIDDQLRNVERSPDAKMFRGLLAGHGRGSQAGRSDSDSGANTGRICSVLSFTPEVLDTTRPSMPRIGSWMPRSTIRRWLAEPAAAVSRTLPEGGQSGRFSACCRLKEPRSGSRRPLGSALCNFLPGRRRFAAAVGRVMAQNARKTRQSLKFPGARRAQTGR